MNFKGKTTQDLLNAIIESIIDNTDATELIIELARRIDNGTNGNHYHYQSRCACETLMG